MKRHVGINRVVKGGRKSALAEASDQQYWDSLPEDDEPVSETDLRAIDEALADYSTGQCLSHDAVTRPAQDLHESAA